MTSTATPKPQRLSVLRRDPADRHRPDPVRGDRRRERSPRTLVRPGRAPIPPRRELEDFAGHARRPAKPERVAGRWSRDRQTSPHRRPRCLEPGPRSAGPGGADRRAGRHALSRPGRDPPRPHGRVAVHVLPRRRAPDGRRSRRDGRSTGIAVQLCGDAHLSNFGLFASPERDLVFDINDFDETRHGPFEWDLKRLAAASWSRAGVGASPLATAVERRSRAVRSYRTHIAEYAVTRAIDVYYARVDTAGVLAYVEKRARPFLEATVKAAVATTRCTSCPS